MRKGKELDNILDECLERILAGGETVEQCLASYPGQAAELEPLLRTAVMAKKAADVRPRADFKERARYQYQAAIRDMELKKERRFFSWQPQWATVLIAVLVVLLVGGGGTVAASQGSLPDEALYQVKLTTEAVRIALTPSDLGKVELYVRLADKRVAEIAEMVNKGKPEQVEKAAELLDSHLVAMVSLAGPPAEEGVFMAPAAPEAAVQEAPLAETPAPRELAHPEVGKGPSLRKGPQVAVEEAAPEVLEAPEVGEGGGDVAAVEEAEPDQKEKIKIALVNRASANKETLRALMSEAPDSARPALRHVIEVAAEGYQQVLEALEEP